MSRRTWGPVAAALVVAGWAANQFGPLAVVYRGEEGWPTLQVVEMFTVYLLGLVPALLLGNAVARRIGRRRLVRLGLAASAVASLLLAAAVEAPDVVYASRLLTGVATGVLVSAGGGWLLALSAGSDADRGLRRVVYATGAGFAIGPLIAGVVAEWSSAPTVVPCLVHATAALLVLAFTRRVPDRDPARDTVATPVADAGERWSAVTHPRFVGVVLPASPAVFAAVTVSYVVLPPLVLDQVADWAPLFAGLVAAVTLTTGLAVQPLAARIDRPGSARAILVAMAVVAVGLLVGALAVSRTSPVLVLAAAVVLGAGYGLTIESGLAEIARIAPPRTLPTLSAAFQGVAHSGFLAPLLLTITAMSVSYPVLLVDLALVGLVLLALAATISRRVGHAHPNDRRLLADAEERSRPWAE